MYDIIHVKVDLKLQMDDGTPARALLFAIIIAESVIVPADRDPARGNLSLQES